MSLSLHIENNWYAWKRSMSKMAVENRLARQVAQSWLKLFLFLLFIASILLAGFFFYLDGAAATVFKSSKVFEPYTWKTFSAFGLIVLQLMIMHAMRQNEGVQEMPKLSKEEVPEITNAQTENVTDLSKLFSKDANIVVDKAFDLARMFKHLQVEPLHLFIATLEDSQGSVFFGRLGVGFEGIKESIGKRLTTRQMGEQQDFSEEAHRVLLRAFQNAVAKHRSQVEVHEIILESYLSDEYIRELLFEKGVGEGAVRNMVQWMRINQALREQMQRFRKAAVLKPTGAMNRSMTSIATPILDSFSEDLTSAAVSGRLPFMVGRDREMEEIFRVIEGGRQSVVLTGSQGVGRSTILAGIAQRMVEERVPDELKDMRLVRISVPHLIAGASPAAAQERLMRALLEVNKSRNIILAVTDIEQMTGLTAGGENTADLAATFVDYLSRSGTFAIATTSQKAYAEAIEQSILGRVFRKVDIQEPTDQQAIHILESKIAGIEYQHNIIFRYDAVEACVTLSMRYIHETYLPQKAIEIASEAALYVSKEKGQNAFVTKEDIAYILSSKTGIPVTAAASEEREKLLNLEEELHKRVIGQNEAVVAVAAALKRARAELRSGNRPIATFLFLGPTGVGKTELAKTIAETYFGSEEAMVRFDMSEYQAQSSINRLIGTPGSEGGGLLTEAIRSKPFSILLLDELEKAHPEILNVFLQVFDDGRLTDATGRTVDFTNTIIVATSNAGTQYIQDSVANKTPAEQMRTHLMEEELKGVYRPEFLNRFDGIIVFEPLKQDEIFQVAKLMLKKVSNRLEEKGIYFEVTDEAAKELSVQGYDPKFGARPMRRVIQNQVDNKIADVLLRGEVVRRDTIVLEKGGIIRVEKAKEL